MRATAHASGAQATWFEALGHDAGRLAAKALAGVPLERIDDAAAVAGLHRRVRDSVAVVTADLWSTEHSGFEGHRELARTLRVVPPPGARP